MGFGTSSGHGYDKKVFCELVDSGISAVYIAQSFIKIMIEKQRCLFPVINL